MSNSAIPHRINPDNRENNVRGTTPNVNQKEPDMNRNRERKVEGIEDRKSIIKVKIKPLAIIITDRNLSKREIARKAG
jgi:hypothetical protein